MRASMLNVFWFWWGTATAVVALLIFGGNLKAESSVQKDLMKTKEIVVGSGDTANSGDVVRVHYSGWLNNSGEKGKLFDSSRKSGQAFEFSLGAGQVIEGWDKGVVGMKVGGKRLLYIPAGLAYGERGAGGVIPPNADLIFEVELLGIR